MTDDAKVSALEARVSELESRRTEASRRALSALKSACPSSWRRRWVPANYYSLSMKERSDILRVPIPSMCKSMLLENKLWCGTSDYFPPDQPYNARYYLVIVQYAAAFSAMKLRSELAQNSGVAKSKFNFRVTNADVCLGLTGYESGAVTPFGIRESRLPIVLAKACAEIPSEIIWMGGGHKQLKFGCDVPEFISHFKPLVLDVSDPRPDGDYGDNITEGSVEDITAQELLEDDDAATKLAIVVGRILKVWPHPDSDKLWCEEIDCGEAYGGVRSIASGLRHHYTSPDALQNHLVLVIANLKSRKLAGFPSQGMVLCASKDSKVVFVDPPSGAKPGDRVYFEGLSNVSPASEKQCDKQKLFTKVQPAFNTKCNGQCFYKNHIFRIPGIDAPCTAPIPDGATLS
uniref:tRNA-binding domain-containing protein n=1 Tax=Aureoumbra lagunensis TaxID=44058 RepID=A0A7S3JTU4_9STRA